MSEQGSKYFFSIRNWERYQHYQKGNRNVKWIKLYTALLFDPDFDRLNSSQKWFYVWCLLMAPSVENRFPLDLKWWRKYSKNVLDLDWIQTRFSLLLELIQTNSRNEVIEHITLPTDLASKMLEQSRVYNKSRVETPIVPLPKSNVKTENRQAAPDLLFARFWDAYPRHENKSMAVKAWNKLPCSNGDRDWILDAIIFWLDSAKQSKQWQDKSLIPHASTFINQRRWEGDPPPKFSNQKQESMARWLDSIPDD